MKANNPTLMKFGIVRLLHGIYSSYLYRKTTRTSEAYISHLRTLGIKIGEGSAIYYPRTTFIDHTRPCLMTIGNNVHITNGVVILTHGAEWLVLREEFHRSYGSAGAVTIEDNVFIGMNAIILKGVTIHRNSIIGAGAVVSRDVPSRSVVAGNPGRVIMTIDEYQEKRVKAQLEEAKAYAIAIKQRHGRDPLPEDFFEFFELFLPRDPERFGGIPVEKQVGAYMNEFLNSKPHFSSFEDFLKYCGIGCGAI